MRRLSSLLISLFAFSAMILLDSCKSKEADPIPLKSNAGSDQTVAAFTTVTLDGSASTGPANLVYEWVFINGPAVENDIQFTGKNGKTATFVPPNNGAYNFALRISQNNQFNEDQVLVTVSGVLTLGGTLTASVTLKDIEPDPTKPDYKLTSDLTIPTGFTFIAPTGSNGLVIEVDGTAGIIIDGGQFTNNAGNLLRLTSATGWKGILLKSGSLSLTGGMQLDKAGKGLFSGQTESAAITALGGNMIVTGTQFTGSTGYDILLTTTLSGSSFINGNTFSLAKPIKTPIGNMGILGANGNLVAQDYIILTTPGAGTQVNSSFSTGFAFQSNTKYYIDGDFTTGSLVNLTSGTTIFMKAGTGIFLSGSSATITGTGGTSTIDGLSGAAWKGIAIGSGAQMSLNGVTIKNAGSEVFNTGSFTSTQKAAVYFAGTTNGSLGNCQIVDSKGYGLYIDTPPGNYVVVSGTTFTNPASPAIRGFVSTINQIITASGAANTFTMPAGVAAVEVSSTSPSSFQPIATWQALGASNYYLITGNIFAGTSWTLAPGVNLKFKAGKSLDIQGGLFTAIGTALNPITFDSEAGTQGTWPGIVVESTYKIEFCQIKNGGEALLFKGGISLATEKANVVFNNATNASNTFKNNTISGSGGYGILVEATKQNPDAANVANANTFSTNTSGNIIVK